MLGPLQFRSRILISSLLFVLPVCAFAQRRGGGVSRSASVSASRTVSAPSTASASVTSRTVSTRPVVVLRSSQPAGRNVRIVTIPNFPTGAVPGLGFDFVHFAAVHPEFRHARLRGALGTEFFPFFDSGFIVPAEPMIVQAQPIIVQQPIIIQQVPQVAEPEDAPEGSAKTSVAPEARAAKQAQSSIDYVFVRRDGGVFFAVAFMRENDRLEYITPEGSHRSVALNSLDLQATQRFNEERGLTFHLPA
jgi:hypothetical protein